MRVVKTTTATQWTGSNATEIKNMLIAQQGLNPTQVGSSVSGEGELIITYNYDAPNPPITLATIPADGWLDGQGYTCSDAEFSEWYIVKE